MSGDSVKRFCKSCYQYFDAAAEDDPDMCAKCLWEQVQENLRASMKDLPPEIAEMVNDNFWKLLA